MSALDVKCDGARDVLREIQNANAQLASEVEAIRERAERAAAAKREARAQARLSEFRRVRSATTIQRAFRRWVANGRKRPKKRKTKTKRAKNTKSRGGGDVKKSTVRAGKTRRAA
jgi:outer membrane murein-binding lipoprotein Lpp